MNVRLSLTTAASLAALALVACGRPEPAAPVADPAPSAPAADADADARAAEPAAAPRKARKPFEIYNACPEVVTLVFSADPKADASSRRTLNSFASSEGPRDDEGNQTVWLLDDAGEPLIKVNVTRGMKRVEVGRSCRTLDAR
jgi:hypothetical protein